MSWEDTLTFNLSGLILHTSPPPGSGAILGGILKVLDQFKPKYDDDEKETIFKFLEASKFAYAQRSKLGDWINDKEIYPEVNETINKILGNKWLDWVLDNWNDIETQLNATYYGADFEYVPQDHGTSHVSILAPNGDAVSITSTVNTYFGSGKMNSMK